MDIEQVVALFGSQQAIADALGIKQPSVSLWRKAGIPDDKRFRIAVIAEERGFCSRKELCPHDWHLIWPELRDNANQSDEASH